MGKINKNTKKLFALLLLVGVVGVVGVFAYFTDKETVTNTFTVGSVAIEFTEPSWVPDNALDLLPTETIAKDPTVKNTGNSDAFVFVEVKVPYANVITANESGSKNPAADTELFTYTVNSGWTEIGTASKDTANGVITHVYAYGTGTSMTKLSKNTSTPAVFDSVTFVNVIEGQGLEGQTKEIECTAKAIQAANLETKTPTEILTIFNNQNN